MLNKTQIIKDAKGSQLRLLKYAKQQYSYISNLYDDYLAFKYHMSLSQDTTISHSMNTSYNDYLQSFNYSYEPSYIIMLFRQLKHNFDEYNLNTLVMAYKVHISNLIGKIADYIIQHDKNIQTDFRQLYKVNDYTNLFDLIDTFSLTYGEKACLQTLVNKMSEKHKALIHIIIKINQEYETMLKSIIINYL